MLQAAARWHHHADVAPQLMHVLESWQVDWQKHAMSMQCEAVLRCDAWCTRVESVWPYEVEPVSVPISWPKAVYG